jgi:two-component system chemotaxis response regulator CheB
MARIIGIGASHGGVEALRTIIHGLPADFAAPLLIILHIGTEYSQLPSLLAEVGSMPATHAETGDEIRAGHILVAPTDRHMLAIGDRIVLSRGPPENWARPSIDPLFRSLAEHHGADAIGVVLTGGLSDGTAGLLRIKQCGGTAIVQDPATAAMSSMPQSALKNVKVDFCVSVRDIAGILVRLANEGRSTAH